MTFRFFLSFSFMCFVVFNYGQIGFCEHAATNSIALEERKTIRSAADGIVAMAIKARDLPVEEYGITMFTAKPAKPIIIPYFANFAAIGLVGASRALRAPRYLEVAKSWERFYDTHRNEDGTIYDLELTNGRWTPTNRMAQAFYDSTDAYAATHLELVYTIYKAGTDSTWLATRLKSVESSLQAIELTAKPNGLFDARPGYNFALTMDSIETLRGLRSAQRIGEALHDEALETKARRLANALEAAMNQHLWDEKSGCYKWNDKQSEGAELAHAEWYPMLMTNTMAVAWLPKSAKSQCVYKMLRSYWPCLLKETTDETEHLDKLVWIAMAAANMGDSQILKRAQTELLRFNGKMPHWFRLHLNAHVLRVMTGDVFNINMLLSPQPDMTGP